MTVRDDATGHDSPYSSLGDGGGWLRFERTGAVDASSQSFDYLADLAATAGADVSVDDSAAWVDGWGYPLPVLNEDGVYAVRFGASSITPWSASLTLLGPDLAMLPMLGGNGALTAVGGVEVNSLFLGSVGLVAKIPAGTHLDLYSLFMTTDADNILTMLIQRVG